MTIVRKSWDSVKETARLQSVEREFRKQFSFVKVRLPARITLCQGTLHVMFRRVCHLCIVNQNSLRGIHGTDQDLPLVHVSFGRRGNIKPRATVDLCRTYR